MTKKLFTILILLIVASAAAGLAYTQVSKHETAQLVNTNQGDEVDTSDWELYRTSDSGLTIINSINPSVEFKYPKNWTITEGGGEILLRPYSINKGTTEDASIGFALGIPTTDQIYAGEKTIDVWCKEDLLHPSVYRFDPELKRLDILERGYQKIGGQLNPYLIYHHPSQHIDPNGKLKVVCLFMEDKVGIIGYYFFGEENQKIYETIISTVKFAD